MNLSKYHKNKLKQFGMGVIAMSFLGSAQASNFFATPAGKAMDASSIGQLFFASLEVMGVIACYKALLYIYQNVSADHTNVRFGYGGSLLIFFAGVLLYWHHLTINVLYNTFFW